MYLRTAHAETDIPSLYTFIKSNPLGIFTTAIPSESSNTIQSSHIPFILDIPDHPSSETSVLSTAAATLRGHIARANPQCKTLIAAALANTNTNTNNHGSIEDEVMVLFNGPVHHYVTPKFYVETKPSTGKVVPTWNYSAVQVYGRLRVYHDTSSPETDAFLTKQIDDLSLQSEREIFGFDGKEGRKGPWSVSESPESYVQLLKKAIVGLEIEVTSLGGKWKMSQELKEGDRMGVVEGFEALGTDEGTEIARTVREREAIMNEKKMIEENS